MHIVFIFLELALLGAPSVFPSIPPILGALMFWTAVAGLLAYPAYLVWLYRKDIGKQLDPSTLLFVGIAGAWLFMTVALAAVIWARFQSRQAYHSSAPFISTKSEMPQATTPLRRISRADLEERRKLLNAMFQVVNGSIRETAALVKRQADHIDRNINYHPEETSKLLAEFNKRVKDSVKELQPLLRQAEIYPDIAELKLNSFNEPITEENERLIRFISNIPTRGSGVEFKIGPKGVRAWQDDVANLHKWIDVKKSEIRKLIESDNQAELV